MNHSDLQCATVKRSELGARLQNNFASCACASFSNGSASRAIAYFSKTKIRVMHKPFASSHIALVKLRCVVFLSLDFGCITEF